jgi:hypothetical protein
LNIKIKEDDTDEDDDGTFLSVDPLELPPDPVIPLPLSHDVISAVQNL